jgi:hypothetical protein
MDQHTVTVVRGKIQADTHNVFQDLKVKRREIAAQAEAERNERVAARKAKVAAEEQAETLDVQVLTAALKNFEVARQQRHAAEDQLGRKMQEEVCARKERDEKRRLVAAEETELRQQAAREKH